jgi:hypothetical protein
MTTTPQKITFGEMRESGVKRQRDSPATCCELDAVNSAQWGAGMNIVHAVVYWIGFSAAILLLTLAVLWFSPPIWP